MSPRWQDAAFEQEHLLRAVDGYFGLLCDSYQTTTFGIDETGPKVLRGIHQELFQRAEPIYVSPEAMTLWEHARESFDAEPIHRTDLVAPAGFALLPWGTTVTDIHDMRIAYRAICWLPISSHETMRWDEDVTGQGVWYSLLSHVDDTDEIWMGAEGENGNGLRKHARASGWRWSLMHGSPLLFEQPTWELFEDDRDAEQVKMLHRHAQSFWRLMSQLVPIRERLPRQARRQRARQRSALPDEVVVIRLRRARVERDGAEAREDSVEWTRQWIVRGHWRNQHYRTLGSKDDPQAHRQIWISPYVKGPEDKPLVIVKRAFEWNR